MELQTKATTEDASSQEAKNLSEEGKASEGGPTDGTDGSSIPGQVKERSDNIPKEDDQAAMLEAQHGEYFM